MPEHNRVRDHNVLQASQITTSLVKHTYFVLKDRWREQLYSNPGSFTVKINSNSYPNPDFVHSQLSVCFGFVFFFFVYCSVAFYDSWEILRQEIILGSSAGEYPNHIWRLWTILTNLCHMIQLQGLIYHDLFILAYSRTCLSYKSNIQENQVTSVHRSSLSEYLVAYLVLKHWETKHADLAETNWNVGLCFLRE